MADHVLLEHESGVYPQLDCPGSFLPQVQDKVPLTLEIFQDTFKFILVVFIVLPYYCCEERDAGEYIGSQLLAQEK